METSHATNEQSKGQAGEALSVNPRMNANDTTCKAKRGLSRALSRLTKSFKTKRYIQHLLDIIAESKHVCLSLLLSTACLQPLPLLLHSWA